MSDAVTQTEAPAAPPAAVTSAPSAPPAAPASTSPAPAASAPAEAPAAGQPATPDKDAAPAEGKPSDGKPTDAAPPAELELKFPDGVQVDTALVDSFKALAKESGLAAPAAQKLADLYVDAQSRAAKAQAEAFDRQQKAWESELRSDKDMGGPAFDANVSTARRAIERFGSPALKQLLNDTGLGNHPELARFALRVGRALAEDSVAGASAASQATQSEDAMLAALYPSMRKEK